MAHYYFSSGPIKPVNMASSESVPQSATPVAFEIPIKKDLNGSSPTNVQKRLANSPRKEISLEDINRKLEAAEASRDNDRNNWMRKLSLTTKTKIKRAAKIKEEEHWSAKDLEAKIDQKRMAADLRSKELKLKSRELGISNDNKLRRGKLALALKEVEARQTENQSRTKVDLAHLRREKIIQEQQETLQKLGRMKEEKAAALNDEEDTNKQRLTEIEGKMKSADERRAEILRQKVKGVAAQPANARKQEEPDAQRLRVEIEERIVAAEDRKRQAIIEKVEGISARMEKHEKLISAKQKEEEVASESKSKLTHAKLFDATKKKDEMLAREKARLYALDMAKREKAKKSWLSSLNEAKELKQTSDEKQTKAMERKNKMMQERVREMQNVNKGKIEKVNKMNQSKCLEDERREEEIAKRLALASAKRENLVAKSTSKKRVRLSPRPSPTSKTEIEERIDQANARREIFLTNKVEKAKKGCNSPKIKKALFAALSPKRTDSEDRVSPRIKAARLEEFEPIEEEDNGYHGLNLPLIAISGIAIVLVGFLSFMKSK